MEFKPGMRLLLRGMPTRALDVTIMEISSKGEWAKIRIDDGKGTIDWWGIEMLKINVIEQLPARDISDMVKQFLQSVLAGFELFEVMNEEGRRPAAEGDNPDSAAVPDDV